MAPRRDPTRDDALAQRLDEITIQMSTMMQMLQNQNNQPPPQPTHPNPHRPTPIPPPPLHPHSDNSSDDDTVTENPFARRQHPQHNDSSHKWENSFKLDLPELAENLQPDDFVD